MKEHISGDVLRMPGTDGALSSGSLEGHGDMAFKLETFVKQNTGTAAVTTAVNLNTVNTTIDDWSDFFPPSGEGIRPDQRKGYQLHCGPD